MLIIYNRVAQRRMPKQFAKFCLRPHKRKAQPFTLGQFKSVGHILLIPAWQPVRYHKRIFARRNIHAKRKMDAA